VTAAAVDTTNEELFCPECGYSLRGIDDVDRCPECGHALDRARLTASNIPWTHRGEIGAVKAYLRTVRLVVRHPSRAAADVARPVSFDDARTFRHVTVLVALAALVALLAWGCVEVVRDRPIAMSGTSPTPVRIGWLLEILLAPVIVVALYAFLLAASGLASCFFHPRRLPVERQNRSVALSYYACAPLALTPISIASVLAALLARHYLATRQASAVLIGVVLAAGAVVPLIQAAASILAPLFMLERTTRCGLGRVLFLALALPIGWALLAAMMALGIPAAYLFVAVVIMSLIG
jgi:hypothetical protein